MMVQNSRRTKAEFDAPQFPHLKFNSAQYKRIDQSNKIKLKYKH